MSDTRLMDELDLRVRNHAYVSFVRDGIAPTPADAAADLGLAEAEAAAAYRRLHDAHALVLEPDSVRIRMLNPFSAVETPHRVESAGRSWFANCAWDALGIPAALHADGRIESVCPDCAEPLELEVATGELVRGSELLVHFVVPARHWWDDIGFT
jgi:Alkylmercury lyase